LIHLTRKKSVYSDKEGVRVKELLKGKSGVFVFDIKYLEVRKSYI